MRLHTTEGQCRISAVIKARNEADQIIEVIQSLQDLAQEVIVVNDASTDETGVLATKAGARVIDAESVDGHINYLDYLGFERARGQWLLRLDADERMTPTLASALRSAIEEPGVVGIRFARKNYFFGDWLRHGGWLRADQLRMFRSDAWDRNWNYRDIHSQVPVRGGRVITLPPTPGFATDHFNYDTVNEFISRSLKGYARNDALLLKDRGESFRLRTLLWRPMRRFLGRFVRLQGFRDGWRGLVVACLLGAYEVAVQFHLRSIKRSSFND